MAFIQSEYGQQSEILSQVVNPCSLQVIAVTAGKGGVGKSNIALNLAIALSQQGKRVVLLDADLGLSNIDVLLGIHANKTLADVLCGACSLREILIDGPAGIQIIPSSFCAPEMTRLSSLEYSGLIAAFNDIAEETDVLVIDTPPGISETVLRFIRSSQEVIVVVCDEPASISDSYALIKILSQSYGVRRFHILANRVHVTSEGRELFSKLSHLCEQFLDVQVDYFGCISEDAALLQAVKHQKAVLQCDPDAKFSREICKLSEKVLTWQQRAVVSGNTPFFLERLVQQPTLSR